MESTFEKYKGIKIEIKATHQSGGLWTARAEFTMPGNETANTNSDDSSRSTEEEARQAALQVAIEIIDRARISTGKP